ncbi:MAG: 2-oxoglutarate dehydrogenase complex dihydrolipoyllysine-residue succinyltransferase [Hyphomonadaceae bacterium]|nr:2-oxoglutarate dehydrogenase complex dihydrolipoyllysine-residue succinyltransferase [Hyphomonadaceae bacterium]
MTDIVVPTLGESVTEATVAKWLKQPGDAVAKDETLVELETDKVSVEVSAPEAGTLGEIVAAEGATVEIGALLGRLGAGAARAASKPAAAAPAAKAQQPAPAAAPAPPSVQRLAAENGISVSGLAGTGKDGRVTKGDALAALAAKPIAPAATPAPAPASAPAPAPVAPPAAPRRADAREERVKMTRLRATIARRLKEAQNTAAMLTTFNEADMSPVMAVRARYKDKFEEKHGVKLGFMSFFVKACVTALKEVPSVNAEIEGDEIVFKNYYDLGIAVGTDKGLVVPVVRDADRKSMATLEQEIGALGKKARDGQLKLEDLQGATFTISNGGVYGSLMSTPILNAPQSGILGMHKIQDRPVVSNGQIVIRPMMYLALSYDHRLVDGKEAVTFLVRVKENLEDPERMLLDL